MESDGTRSLLVLGGARSGKSRYAENRAEALGGELFYLATGQAGDAEMADRIERHRADRGDRWQTLEVPLALDRAIAEHAAPGRVLLVDCLTLWVSNLLLGGHDVNAACLTVSDALKAASGGAIIFVSNEVGLGIVPDNALARQFRDDAGRTNQQIAQRVDEVVFVAAGLPLRLKG